VVNTPLPRILSVDDDLRNQRIMQDLLGEEFLVDLADCAEACTSRIAATPPDLILLDVMMPGTDGYGICSQIKADASTRHIPIIFVSGRDSLEDRIRGYEAGGDDYFVKPFDHEELLVKIKKTLQAQAQWRQLATQANEASAMAMKTMREMGNMGVILRFYESSFAAHDEQALMRSLFEATEAFGWNCCAQIRGPSMTLDAAGNGAMTPLEQSLLSRAASRGRFVDFKQRTIVNFDHISLLIKNMPVEDEVRYGAARDHVCLILNGAEARIRGFAMEAERNRKAQQLRAAIETTSRVLEELRTRYHALRVEGASIVEDMSDEIHELVLGLALTEKQEKGLEAIAERGVERTTALFNRGIGLDEHFAALAAQLGEMSRG